MKLKLLIAGAYFVALLLIYQLFYSASLWMPIVVLISLLFIRTLKKLREKQAWVIIFDGDSWSVLIPGEGQFSVECELRYLSWWCLVLRVKVPQQVFEHVFFKSATGLGQWRQLQLSVRTKLKGDEQSHPVPQN